ncbi:uncharacterized protein RAG0_15618 [Rhynchosporium agropyri]|uniref:Uncharacterized protein n=1 Tax=Rhynchosporium agropyri TaxID=914238 RepID=A0A1E1LLV2_9HELO|nr:uncharacterized protein RAG0_15618 [Rhynchosporium agropyri]
MASEERLKSAKATQDELAISFNRIAMAMAKREALVKSWTASASSSKPEKTQEELEAEDAAMFRNEPPHLGVGAEIPAHFLVTESERGNKALRAKMFTTKGLKASKARDAEEKAASAKRRMREESSEEEGGRSSLGRAKKFKGRQNTAPVPELQGEDESNSEVEEDTKQMFISKRREIEEKPIFAAKAAHKADLSKEDDKLEMSEETADGKLVPSVGRKKNAAKIKTPKPVVEPSGVEKNSTTSVKKDDGMDAAERRRQKKKEKKKLKKLRDAEQTGEA